MSASASLQFAKLALLKQGELRPLRLRLHPGGGFFKAAHVNSDVHILSRETKTWKNSWQ
jgi:hypothetical protein